MHNLQPSDDAPFGPDATSSGSSGPNGASDDSVTDSIQGCASGSGSDAGGDAVVWMPCLMSAADDDGGDFDGSIE